MDVGPLAEKIDDELRAAGSPERAVREKAYLKSALDHYGATMPVITSIAKAVRREHPELDHDDLVALGVSLWSRPVHERRMTAAALFELNSQLLDTEDVPLLERWLRESRTWALVDGIAASVVGPLVERRPELRSVLDRWACDDDFWIRRSALLGLLPGLRQGAGDFERFSRYADSMLDDKEFFLRKAIGWVLRQRPGSAPGWSSNGCSPAPDAPPASRSRGRQAAFGRAADGGPRRPVKR